MWVDTEVGKGSIFHFTVNLGLARVVYGAASG